MSPLLVPPAGQSRRARLLGAAVLGLLSALLLLPDPRASAESAVPVTDGSVTIRGAGSGHGHGMSQWGAYGAARSGLTWRQVLAFYYPGTSLGTVPAGSKVRVWLTADADDELRVRPAAGLAVRDAGGGRRVLPSGSGYTGWRIRRSGAGYALSYRTAAGRWRAYPTSLSTSTWSFTATGGVLRLVLPGGATREYRGSLGLVKRGTGGRTVNTVGLEDYLRAVVPAEMPTSWAREAVRAQAVAARSYAVRLRDAATPTGYDLCDTSACQVYGGRARETAAGDAAVTATARTVVTYRGTVALTQFGASDGGATAAGGLPYLAAGPDPYDGLVASQTWTRTLTADRLSAAWPSVGSVRTVRVLSRDGSGRWGGRVLRVRVTGSLGAVTVSGTTFASRFGLRSSLFTVTG